MNRSERIYRLWIKGAISLIAAILSSTIIEALWLSGWLVRVLVFGAILAIALNGLIRNQYQSLSKAQQRIALWIVGSLLMGAAVRFGIIAAGG